MARTIQCSRTKPGSYRYVSLSGHVPIAVDRPKNTGGEHIIEMATSEGRIRLPKPWGSTMLPALRHWDAAQKLNRAPNSPANDLGTITPDVVMKPVGCWNVDVRIFAP